MRPLSRTCVFLFLASCAALAQRPAEPVATPLANTPQAGVSQEGPSQGDVPVFTTDTRFVVVHASVLDNKGKLVAITLEHASENTDLRSFSFSNTAILQHAA